jgi:predicted secreted protein
MTTQARLGYGTLLQRWVSPSWVTVAEQVSISGPSLSSDDVEVTNHDSPGGSKEYIPALMDTGEVSFDGNFIPGDASQQRLLSDQRNRTVAQWRIVLPDATDIDNRSKWTFDGYIKSLDFSYPTPDQMTISGTMKLAGAATLASVESAVLTGLVVTGDDSGALTAKPALSLSDTYEYAYVAGGSDTEVTVTATCAAADEIYVNSASVTSGVASGAITLEDGANTIVVRVVEEDKNARLYTLIVVK